MDEFKRDDPNVIIPLPEPRPRVAETIIVQREVKSDGNSGWWALGIFSALVLIAVVWMLTRTTHTDNVADVRLAQAEAAAADAQATADAAIAANRMDGARDSVAIAQAQAMQARAEALEATQQARAAQAQAQAANPVVVERQTITPGSTPDSVVVTTTRQ